MSFAFWSRRGLAENSKSTAASATRVGIVVSSFSFCGWVVTFVCAHIFDSFMGVGGAIDPWLFLGVPAVFSATALAFAVLQIPFRLGLPLRFLTYFACFVHGVWGAVVTFYLPDQYDGYMFLLVLGIGSWFLSPASSMWATLAIAAVAAMVRVLLHVGMQRSWGIDDIVAVVIGTVFVACAALFNQLILNLRFSLRKERVAADNGRLELARAIQEISSRTKDIETIFGSINVGVCMVDSSMRILSHQSKCLLEMLGVENLTGMDLLPALFSASNLTIDKKDLLLTTLHAFMNEPLYTFQLNAAHLPREITLSRDGQTRDIEISWTPIQNEEGNIERCMLSFRDVTTMHSLRAEVEEEKQAGAIVTELLMVEPAEFDRLKAMVEHALEGIGSMAMNRGEMVDAEVSLILRILHTAKGNARTLKLVHLAGSLHALEDQVSRETGRRANLGVGSKRGVLVAAREVSHMLLLHDQVSKRIQMRGGQVYEQRNILLSQILHLSSRLREQQGEAQMAIICEQIYGRALSAQFPTLQFVVQRVASGVQDLAQDLGKKEPRVSFVSSTMWVLTHEGGDALFSAFSHLMRNTLDHGFSDLQRGEICVLVRMVKAHLEIRYSSNEAGLHLGVLANKASEHGFSFSSDEELASIIFRGQVSTAVRVSSVSGRGVGMEAVHALIVELGGSIRVEFTGPRDELERRPFCFVISLPGDIVVHSYDSDDLDVVRHQRVG